jgi:hypothetical protein
MNQMCIHLPEALEKDGYRNPEDPSAAAMTRAFGTTLWEVLETDDNARSLFDAAMEQQDDLLPENLPDGEVNWTDMLGAVAAPEVAFVDVGGGNGHVMLKIMDLVSNKIPGRFVLQDQKGAIEAATAAGVPFVCMEHNFFQPQPIRGAKAYHIRRCLHDWSDGKCVEILSNIRDAMHPGYSRLLIHEFVLPVVGAEQREVLFDILMLCLSGAERDVAQWESLLEESGLRTVRIWRAKIGHMAIIEAEAV